MSFFSQLWVREVQHSNMRRSVEGPPALPTARGATVSFLKRGTAASSSKLEVVQRTEEVDIEPGIQAGPRRKRPDTDPEHVQPRPPREESPQCEVLLKAALQSRSEVQQATRAFRESAKCQDSVEDSRDELRMIDQKPAQSVRSYLHAPISLLERGLAADLSAKKASKPHTERQHGQIQHGHSVSLQGNPVPSSAAAAASLVEIYLCRFDLLNPSLMCIAACLVLLRLSEIGGRCEESLVPSSLDSHVVVSRPDNQKYQFHSILYPGKNANPQTEVIKSVFSNLAGLFQAKSSSIFMLGASQSGKSFPIQGTRDFPGLLPRTVEELFKQLRSIGSSILEIEETGSIVDWLKDFDMEGRGPNTQRGPMIILSSTPERIHKAIKHALVSRKKIAKPGILGSTVFRFTLHSAGRAMAESGPEGTPASLNIIELSSKSITNKLEKERAISTSTSGFVPGLRRLYGAYSAQVVSALAHVIQPSLQMSTIFFFNIFNRNHQTETLLQLSQWLLEKPDPDPLLKRLVSEKKTKRKPSQVHFGTHEDRASEEPSQWKSGIQSSLR